MNTDRTQLDIPLLSVAAVADGLGISRRTVLRLIARAELPAIRVGDRWRVDVRDLDAYLSRGRNIA
jgi:excisionase family DNA binding protein